MINKNSIHIALTSDNNYVVLLGALIKSIINNHHTDENVVFYILSDNISKENQIKINSLIVQSSKIEFKWFEHYSVIPSNIKYPLDNSRYPYVASLRLFAPYILDSNVKRLLYFDVDMIVEGDVSELWNINLKGYIIGAVIDMCKNVDCTWAHTIPNYKELGIPKGTKYFNSGLLVIDVEKWKSEKIQQQVFKVMVANTKYLNLPDQYGLNVVFANRWLEIDPMWNWYAHNYHPNPKNIHFISIKPTFKSCDADSAFIKLFLKYLNLTPWKGMKLKSDYQRLINKGIIKIKKYLTRR